MENSQILRFCKGKARRVLHCKAMMRIATVALLALMLFDFGVDLWQQGEAWDSDSGAALPAASLETLSVHGISNPSTKPDVQHECVCCCAHVEQLAPISIAITLESSPSRTMTRVSRPDPLRVPIFHPPQVA